MKNENKGFLFVFILVGIVYLLQHTLTFFIPIYLKDIGLSGFEIGLLFSIYSLAAIISLFEAGIFSDRLSPKVMIIISICMLTFFYLSLSMGITILWILIVLFIIFGLAQNIMKIATDSFALKKATNNKGKIFGKYELFRMLPAALGFVIGGLLLTLFQFTTTLRLVGLTTLLLLWLAILVPKTKTHKANIKKYLIDFKDKKVIIFSALIFLFTLHWGVEQVAYGLLLKERLLLSFTSMGLFIAIPIVFLAFSAFYFGTRSDKKMPANKMLTIAFLLSGIGFTLLGLTTNVGISLAGRIIHEIGDGAFSIFLLIGAARYFKKNRMGGDYGLIMMVAIIASFLGALIFSPIGEHFGYHIPHIISGLIMVAVAISFFLFHHLHVKKTIN